MSRNFSLFPIRKLQRCPRYIPHDVAQSIRRLEVCRLHERVDVNDFKHTFLMGRANAVASFRDCPSVFGNHFDSPFKVSFVRCFPLAELFYGGLRDSLFLTNYQESFMPICIWRAPPLNCFASRNRSAVTLA